MKLSLDEIDPSWHDFFRPRIDLIDSILTSLQDEVITPERENIFRAFRVPLPDIRVVIFGQDPYPGVGIADGLAFSSKPNNPIPASLRNIFKEYSEDLGISIPTSPDLSNWSNAGVLLLNRSLTTVEGSRNAHLSTRWKDFTLDVAKYLGERQVVAILWGNFARELSEYFEYSIESAHPSPLSARRGFLGSKPFTTSNAMLTKLGRQPIDWQL